ncbi:hypothetical protein [Azospirillum sp. SYSU D00513]|uniref:hypothetical protein n=1 Tax=Azospirillum sp. SYSU D00513 TaxID=2812561 RepID=UPI001A95FD61|nr:hypothetical protein [Azospirillum sp. SYSU D00513]
MNSEIVNDRAKLIYHRLIARRIAGDPDLVRRARNVLDNLATDPNQRAYVGEWRNVLAGSDGQIRNFIVSRGQDATRLRISSPFPLLPELSIEDEQIRRRLWRKAKTFARSTTWNALSAP